MADISAEDIKTQIRQERYMALIERPYISAIVTEKNRFIDDVSQYYAINDSISPDALYLHRNNLFEISKIFNSRIIKFIALDVTRNTVKSLHFKYETKTEAFDKWLMFIINQWLVEETAKSVNLIAQTTYNDVQEAIIKAFEGGESNVQIAKTILQVKGFSAFRAATIALTETHNAAMYASKQSALKIERDADVELHKKWIPVQDQRTRDNHRAMASHDAIPMQSLFTVGGDKMDRPGDPNGSPENIIRCRCVLTYKAIS